MVSITRYCKRTSWPLLCIALCLGGGQAGFAAEEDGPPFLIRSAEVERGEQSYRLRGIIDFGLNDTVLEALHNGVSLTIETQARLYRQRDWIWDKQVSGLDRRYRLRYFALSQLYLLTNLDDESKRSFLSLSAALYNLGHFDAELAPRHEVLSGQPHYLRMRIFLDIESLPAPLRPLAYMSSRWRLKSKWHEWTLDI
ncbi:MAG: DUF4390 domain-containing protein [Gammaproteobacteria bacterium]|nr:DUF4390 domain-containing protein [Gammaproteobacteria bacterium]